MRNMANPLLIRPVPGGTPPELAATRSHLRVLPYDLLKEASSNRPIIAMIGLAGAASFFVGTAYQAQMPEYAHDLDSDHADTSYSTLLAAGAAGAFIGGVVLERRLRNLSGS